MKTTEEVDGLFAGRNPVVRKVYDALLKRLRTFGPVVVEAKKTSIHLVNGTAFAGVHPRRDSILLNIRTDTPLPSKRIRKREQVSKNRCHNELILSDVSEVDDELAGWLSTAYHFKSSAKAARA